jgi:hypothetical protein
MKLCRDAADAYLQTGPSDDIRRFIKGDREDKLRSCFNHRALNLFLGLMGLASFEKIRGDKPFSRNYQIRKRPLLDEVVKFGFRFR